MSVLEIRLFGGFEVRWGQSAVGGFESQKVRALLAYLVLAPAGPCNRDRLASTLWPDEGTATARKNLRQAIYNLRTSLERVDPSFAGPVIATHQTVQLDPALPWWSDVATFEETARQGWAPGHEDVALLTRAARLYRGPLLAGFWVKGSVTFEDWLLAEQEKYREMAIQVLRRLVDHHERAGDVQLAVTYALRLVEIDSLSEETHRELMRLYALSGRRSAALAEYHTLRLLLRKELDVAPLHETTALYDALAADDLPPAPAAGGKSLGGGPELPLVGRGEARQQLRSSWDTARRGRARVALLTGDEGTGKTRLALHVLAEANAVPGVTILQACGAEAAATRPLHLVAELLREGLELETPEARRRLAGLHPAWQAQLRTLLPELSDAFPGADAAPPDADVMSAAIAELLAALLPGLAGAPRQGPVVLFVDDVDQADEATLALLPYLADTFAERPLWILLAGRPGAGRGLATLAETLARQGTLDRVAVGALGPAEVAELGRLLGGDRRGGELATVLARLVDRRPVTLSETVDALRDAGMPVRGSDRPWRVPQELAALFGTPSLESVVPWRMARLPSSVARLLAVAAVIGRRFDASLLRRADSELQAVVTTVLGALVEARYIRSVTVRFEPPSGDGKSLDGDAADGVFEFCHSAARRVLYGMIEPGERQLLHEQIAAALAAETAPTPEAVAHHLLQAGEVERALPWLARAAERSAALGAARPAPGHGNGDAAPTPREPAADRRRGNRRQGDRRGAGGEGAAGAGWRLDDAATDADRLLRQPATPWLAQRTMRATGRPDASASKLPPTFRH